jgi:hypothetical protein
VSPQDLAALDEFLDQQWKQLIEDGDPPPEPPADWDARAPREPDLDVYPEWVGVRCGHCHSVHATTSDVRTCGGTDG